MPRNTSYCCFSSSSSSLSSPVSAKSSKTTNQFKIPIVDFSSFLSLDGGYTSEGATVAEATDIIISAEQQSTAREIDKANKQHGFVCLRNTGIPKSTIQSTFQSTTELFNLDDKVKSESLKQIDPLTNTGYAGFGKESLNRRRRPDLKEAFNVRNPSTSKSKSIDVNAVGDFFDGTPEEFQKNSLQLWDDLKVVGYRFSICCAVALGFEKDYFVKTLALMDLCTLRVLHYPPCDEISDVENVNGDGSNSNGNYRENTSGSASTSMPIRVGEHTDFGIFTFLFVRDFQKESSHGLQVKAVEGGELHQNSREGVQGNDEFNSYLKGWNDVVFDQETLQRIDDDESCAVIVNTGALMARWTNDVWRATAHRVIVPSIEARKSHRYSIAMFFDPDKETLCSVHPKLIEDKAEGKGKAKYEPIKSIDYLLMKLNEAQRVNS